MVSLRKSDTIQISAFVFGGQFIHQYENIKRQLIIKSPSPVTNVVLNYNNDELEFWVATANCVYRITENDTRTYEHTGQISTKDEADISNQEIFDDLLDNDIVHPFSGTLIPTSEPVFVLKDSYTILQENSDILCLAVVDTHLWCLEQKDKNFSISYYSLKTKQTGSRECLSLITRYELNFKYDCFDEDGSKFSLYLVVSETYTKSCKTSSSSIVISTQMFSVLFGKEAALSGFPVLVISTPDGRMYSQQLSEQELSESDHWKMFSETGSCISYIACINLDESETVTSDPTLFPLMCQSEKGSNDVILICCEMGKVVVVGENSNGSVTFCSLAVHGPVLSWSCQGKYLFHCSKMSVFRSTIIKICDEGKEDITFSIQTEIIHDISISQMAFVPGPVKSEECMLCYTETGDLYILDTHPTKFTLQSRSLTMKELLMGLDSNSKRRTYIQKQQNHLNIFLQQLNMASHLISEEKKVQRSRLIRSHCSLESYRCGYSKQYCLSVTLTNESPASLSPDWNINILITTNNQSETELESHDFPLFSGLKAKTDFLMKIPLSEKFTRMSDFKVTVQLVVNLDKTFLETGSETPLHLPLFVSSHVIDIFSFIGEDSTPPGYSISFDETLKKLAYNRHYGDSSYISDLNHLGDSKPKLDSCSHKVYSAEILLPFSSLLSDFHEDDCTPEQILRFLLQDSQINTDNLQHGQGQFLDPSGNTLALSVKKETSSDNNSNNSSGNCSSSNIVTVCVRSDSLPLVARCRMAVINRLQKNDADVTPCSRKQVRRFLQQMENLREALQNLQDSYSKHSSWEAESVQELYSLYEKLRQTNLQTSDS